MPRPRKSRLVPSLVTACEELLRHIGDQVEAALRRQREELLAEIVRLRHELALVARRSGRLAEAPLSRVGRPRSDRMCSVKGCGQPHVARGLCKNHYQQMRYVEKKAASGQTVRRRRTSGALATLLEAAKAHGADVSALERPRSVASAQRA
ncbi:MAG TPA: hypothetical protein VKN99_18820 [Polyangia bacterium]|nr:hypothetical protein [Polyangia bacterium]